MWHSQYLTSKIFEKKKKKHTLKTKMTVFIPIMSHPIGMVPPLSSIVYKVTPIIGDCVCKCAGCYMYILVKKAKIGASLKTSEYANKMMECV